MSNQKLQAARKEKHWTIAVAAEKVGVSWITYSRWEKGTQKPYLSTLDQLCTAFKRTPQELGFSDLIGEPLPEKSGNVAPELPSPSAIQNLTIVTLTKEQAALLLSLIGDNMDKFDPSRRTALLELLSITGIAATTPQHLLNLESWQQIAFPKKPDTKKIDETMLQGFEQLIRTCWQFSKGSDLTLAEQLLPNYMDQLISLAQQPSKYQATVTELTAQGYQLYSIFALHHNNLLASELYCKQAVQYSLASGNPNILVPSLRRLADTYRYLQMYPELLQTYLQALQHVNKISPLLQSCIYRGVAVAYAHLGQKQESLRYIGLAKDVFPNDPTKDPSFSFAEFDLPWLIMGEGMARSQIGQTKQALDIFNQIEQPDIIIPERIRLEIINQRAKTAIISGDLEQSSTYIEAGTIRAKIFRSQRRYSEAYENFRMALLQWPQEKQVKTLEELFH